MSDRSNITEDDYYEISRKDKLPKRCPILHICERRFWTLYYFNSLHQQVSDLEGDERQDAILDIIKDKYNISKSFERDKVEVRGADNRIVRGSSGGVGFSEMCPEVALFEDHGYQMGIPRIAAIGGHFGGERKSGYYCGHYSECAEFSYYQYEKRTRRVKNVNRVGISKKLRFEIYQRDKFTCQYCGKTKDDGIKLEIDHRIAVDRGGTTDYHNLITSCHECNAGKSNKAI